MDEVLIEKIYINILGNEESYFWTLFDACTKIDQPDAEVRMDLFLERSLVDSLLIFRSDSAHFS